MLYSQRIRRARVCRHVAALAIALPTVLSAQSSSGAGDPPTSATVSALATWLSFDAPPGEEWRAANAILAADKRWQRDQLGNLVLRAGSGRPRRMVACGLDHVGLVVSQITDAGYLRLHRAGSAQTHPLWDQFHEAQQIRVLTRKGIVPGVVAVPNGHFARQHRGDTAVVNVDELWVDVGARTRAEAEALGIALLDPVVRDLPPWPYAEYVSGPNATGRVACAAVATAARGAPVSGETVFVLSAQRAFGWAGAAAIAARHGPFDEVTLVSSWEGRGEDAAAVRRRRASRPNNMQAAGVDSITRLEVRVRFAGALVESVRGTDADSLLAAVRNAAGVGATPPGWLALVTGDADTASRTPARSPSRTATSAADALTPAATLLALLAELPGVPSHEWRVRAAVREALPAWARERVVEDSAGNLILALGPDRDTAVFVAHMDEVAYTVRAIGGDGSVALTAQGGVIPSAWEGQPALLHFDPAERRSTSAPPSIPGVFAPRDAATVRRPDQVRAWFGLDSATLVARGVRVGMGVTGYKRAHRLAATRFTARSLDDRAGTTALLLALRSIDPNRLPNKVIFAWSVHEEGGLIGARALARQLGASVRRVYAIDTFVSSDTPLESPHFAFTPLGSGAVLRGLDDGIVSIATERERVIALARTRGIPLQVGTTHGSTDATPFVAAGAPGMGLSWPGRYSHSPAEVLDLRDLTALARLIEAVAEGGSR